MRNQAGSSFQGGRDKELLCAPTPLEQRSPRIRSAGHGSHSGGRELCSARIPLSGLRPQPEPLHTTLCCFVQRHGGPHPASRTLTLWLRSRGQTASWQQLGRNGRQHMLHVLLHGPVDVWRCLLGALRSSLAPFSALLALKPTGTSHSECLACLHSPGPRSLRRSRSHAHRKSSSAAKWDRGD